MALKKILTASVLSLSLLAISVPVMASQASDITIMNKQKNVTIYQDFPSSADIPATKFCSDADGYYGMLRRTNIVQVSPSHVRAYYSGTVVQDLG
ncbi:hypothetical protein MH215_00025 [Paenibacillus sp. ACRSA]|uniref:hypothetical protein n=1 Tax=Paenibacillus sp. ACRSA TaxID=2918211 RepID=UPI001EF464A2|nr:hypothetical protein [Paenibacillus sp. ACRSA]MCG7375360.1 hypothetical protein [Paenibacillus sp. ACRSA]